MRFRAHKLQGEWEQIDNPEGTGGVEYRVECPGCTSQMRKVPLPLGLDVQVPLDALAFRCGGCRLWLIVREGQPDSFVMHTAAEQCPACNVV